MFYYLDMLISKDDCETQNAELAKQMIDLYSDLIVIYFINDNDMSNEKETFRKTIKDCNTHNKIKQKFEHIANEINEADGAESISRFSKIV